MAVGTGREGRVHPDRLRPCRTSSSLGLPSRHAQAQELAWTPCHNSRHWPYLPMRHLCALFPLYILFSFPLLSCSLAWSSGSPLHGSKALWPQSTHKAESTTVRPLRDGRFSRGGGTATYRFKLCTVIARQKRGRCIFISAI